MVAAPKFDQVKVGDPIKPIVLPPISRHQLALYCGGSGDHNPIHVDLDFAKKFGFKDVFAHGMLSMGFLGRLVTSYAPRDRIRKLGTRFTSITWPGDVITLCGQGHGQARGERREADRPRGQVHQPERPGHAAGPRHRGARLFQGGGWVGLTERRTRSRGEKMGQMDGKVAIVTGSGRGIGKEIALRLVRDGASVVINDIDEAPAKETIAEIEKMGGKAVACNGDVAKPDFGDRIVKTAVDAFGDCHVVVNNAGYTWDSVIQKMSDEQWYAILDVHLTAPFRVLRAFQQHFRQAGREGALRGQAHRAQGREHLLDLGRQRQCRPVELLGRQGGHRRPHQDAGQGVRPLRRHGERRGLRLHPDAPHQAA